MAEAEPAVGLGDLHSEGADRGQSLDGLVRELPVPFDERGVDIGLAELAHPLAELLAAFARLIVGHRMRMDQAQLEIAEEELLAEAGQRPATLPCLLGHLAGLGLADLRLHGGR